MPLFSKKIKCLHCGGNFKARKDRNRRVYVCSRYDNYGECKRIPIEEDFLKNTINKRYDFQLTDDEIKNKVERIEVEDKLLFTIYLKDDDPIVFGKNFIRY